MTGAALLAALLLGLRHATDPDHLTAVSTLVLGEGGVAVGRAGRRAAALGAAWGLGHGAMLIALGAPVVLLGSHLPAGAHRMAEVAVGILIVALAARLLQRWRRGAFHAHPHAHGGRWHAHPHVHERGHVAGERPSHLHPHAEALGRTPLASFGVGLLHGVGGSAGASIVVVAALPPAEALAGLAVFALAAAFSMAVLTALFGHAVGRVPAAVRLDRLVPLFGMAGALFGIWYALGAAGFP